MWVGQTPDKNVLYYENKMNQDYEELFLGITLQVHHGKDFITCEKKDAACLNK